MAGPGRARYVVLTAVIFVLLLLVPVVSGLTAQPYLLVLGSRILVFALAAVGLNLALGFGNMVSFGHAMYIGLGAYCVAIASHYGYDNGVLHLVLTVGVTAAVATIVGYIVLRTRGIAFIMITLALAQMLYYLALGLKQYGGDEGLTVHQLSNFGALTGNAFALYLSLLATLGVVLLLLARLIPSRFGLILRASSIDERRVRAVGTAPTGYRLLAYVFSAVICGLAGYFLANLTSYASPDYLNWMVSGDLIIMVLLGGMATLVGPVVGAAAFILMEIGLQALTSHWLAPMGVIIVLIVLFLRNGIWSLAGLRGRRRP